MTLEPSSEPETPAKTEERICSCGAGHGSLEGHMGWCDWLAYLALPPAPTDALAEVQALRAARDNLADKLALEQALTDGAHRRARNAEAEAARLREALRADLDEMVAEVHGHIKMWGDALRRAEAAEAEFAMARTDADQTRIALRAAEAEVVRLREALTRIEGKDSWMVYASIRSDGPERKVMRGEFGEIAREALQPKDPA